MRHIARRDTFDRSDAASDPPPPTPKCSVIDVIGADDAGRRPFGLPETEETGWRRAPGPWEDATDTSEHGGQWANQCPRHRSVIWWAGRACQRRVSSRLALLPTCLDRSQRRESTWHFATSRASRRLDWTRRDSTGLGVTRPGRSL